MIRIATIGTSAITAQLLDALPRCPEAAFVGTCSRDAERAATFTAAHGGTHPFTSVEELAASPEVDAVYIGSPNACHARQALTCIAGGKHVLVEKPFASNAREARAVFQAAETAGVVALEAMRPLHDPAFLELRSLLGRLGTLRRATLRFGKYSSRYDLVLAGTSANVFDCRMAGGALMDIGIYTVEPLVALFGAPQQIACAAALLDPATRAVCGGAVDGAGTILASYDGMVASLHYSKITDDLAASQFEGELGTLTVDAIAAPRRARLDLRCTDAQPRPGAYSTSSTVAQDIELPARKNSMVGELADFLRAVAAVQDGCAPAEAPAGELGPLRAFSVITQTSLELIDEARRQVGVVFPADAAGAEVAAPAAAKANAGGDAASANAAAAGAVSEAAAAGAEITTPSAAGAEAKPAASTASVATSANASATEAAGAAEQEAR